MTTPVREAPAPVSGSRAAKEISNGDPASRICLQGRAALQLLMESQECAAALSRSEWDFAVEVADLRHSGLTNSDLRWMICMDFAKQASEIEPGDEEDRAFLPSSALAFDRKTCFILTKEGVAFTQRALSIYPVRIGEGDHSRNGNGSADSPTPRWDRDRQELRVGNFVVKQFKIPAVNQERILAAFEEEGWPPHIDDPLPPNGNQDPKRRLHDTINSLNRNQKRFLIRFMGDGRGQGVRWDLVQPIRGLLEGNGSHV